MHKCISGTLFQPGVSEAKTVVETASSWGARPRKVAVSHQKSELVPRKRPSKAAEVGLSKHFRAHILPPHALCAGHGVKIFNVCSAGFCFCFALNRFYAPSPPFQNRGVYSMAFYVGNIYVCFWFSWGLIAKSIKFCTWTFEQSWNSYNSLWDSRDRLNRFCRMRWV